MTDQDATSPNADAAVIMILLIVNDIARSRDYYAHVLGGTIVRDDSPAMVNLYNTTIIINVGGGPTVDKPGVTMAAPTDLMTAGIMLNFRVTDVQAMYERITGRGGEFLTPPQRLEREIRCYLRDPDGYLIEFGQSIEASTDNTD